MLILILLLIVGSILVYISKFNFVPVIVNLGFYTIYDVPLFYVIVVSVLFGLILSYLVYAIGSIATSFSIRSKNNEIKNNKNVVLELTKRIHQLELENEKIKNGSTIIEPQDPKSL